ncbi:MAG: plastocyanin/azurin family copper-binding protein [Natronomonas sp.]
MNRRAFLSAASATVVAVSGCLDGGLDSEDFDIGMSANAFLPNHLTIDVGETVVWGNNGSRGHTVTADPDGIPDEATFFASGDFDTESAARESWFDARSGNIAPGETYAHTFDVRGQHPYYCIPHEDAGMAGVIVVE